MTDQKSLHEEFDQLEILRSITSAYGQLASIWLNQTRDSIITSRDYLSEMHQVFMTVFSSYVREVRKLAKQRNLHRGKNITFLAHNGKKVAVFLSANTGFYGDIISRTFEMFLKDVRENNLEVVIAGRQGAALFRNEEPTMPYTFFDFADEHIDQHQLMELIRHLVQYEEIRVYYGKFQNFMSQQAVMFTISANPYDDLKDQNIVLKKYIFEPSIEKILMFFEKQIFSSVFDQTIRESQLAKAASRVMLMDTAGENIKNRLRDLRHQTLKIKHQRNNQKQLMQFASYSLWGA